MTDGYLSLMRSRDVSQANSDFLAQGSQNAAIKLAVFILNVKQISEIEYLLPSSIIIEVKKVPLQFLENLEKRLESYNIETIFNDLKTIYNNYSNIIENAILKLPSK